MIRDFAMPTRVNSVSLHPDCSMFVCGGEDFKMYKFDYHSGAEIGWYFSFPIHKLILKKNRNDEKNEIGEFHFSF